ncbi:tetratricopeptide repeat protein [Actinoplanes sp. G11-F43]|uniref:tetratricopeptide repeat protein n=1 Tax=Actinoplanes sp. G11-F43 TaxID=3424130 RepID=UPI003D358E42
MTSIPTPTEIAFSLLREGRLADAENVIRREVRAAADKYGTDSHQWASAQCDLGNILLSGDQISRAVDCFRAAADVPARDHESGKDRLTYRLNVGLALRMAGRFDEAEAELRQGLTERHDFYGPDHPGYAFGLEPLADLLRRAGKLDEARQVAEQAVANLWRNGHERVSSALALRAAIVFELGGRPFDGSEFADLPDEVVARTGQALVQISDDKELILALTEALEHRLGPDHPGTLTALSALANLAHDSDDEQTRISAIQRLLASYERQDLPEQALMAEQGLALAYGHAGDAEAGVRSYESAYHRAERLGSPEIVSQVLRNWGLALRDAGQETLAEQRLTEALTQARRGTDPDMVGRAGVALGLFLQHADRLPEARGALEEALTVMDPVHPDAIVGRSHLGAVHEGRTCGCGDMPSTIADAFRDFVLTRLPTDLLAHLDVAVVDNDFKIDVHLKREPTEQELERLNQVFQTAQAEFRHRLTRN